MNSLLSNVYDLLKYKTEKVSCNQRSNSLFCFIKAQTLIIQNRWYNKVYSCEISILYENKIFYMDFVDVEFCCMYPIR